MNEIVIEASANANTYGLAGAAGGKSTARVTAHTDVLVKDGAAISAQRDISLMAGGNDAGDLSRYTVHASTDLWNKTAFPISLNPTANATIIQSNLVDVATDAWIGSNRNVTLQSLEGTHVASGKWAYQDAYMGLAEDIANGFVSLFTGSEGNVSLKETGGNSFDIQSTLVNVNGTVESGLNNKQFLIIDEWINSENNAVMSGNPVLIFQNASGQDTVTRASGSWIADGFAAEQFIQISGTSGLDGAYLIDAVTEKTLTINAKTPLGSAGGTTNAANVTIRHMVMTGTAELDFSTANNAITRSDGSWEHDGFVAGQYIMVRGSGGNDGFYRIAAVSPNGITLWLDSASPLAAATQAVRGASHEKKLVGL